VIGVVVVTHGDLAEALLSTAQAIVGPLPQALAISIRPPDGAEDVSRRIAQAIDDVDAGDGVLLLTDMFGGTPANIGLTFLEEGKAEVLTGVNLPMLIKLWSLRQQEVQLHEAAVLLTQHGQKNISRAADLLSRAASSHADRARKG
jgi:PTS system mannose-specific IIA component